MKTVTVKVSDDMHLELKALAKAYGDTLQDLFWFGLDSMLVSKEDGTADLEIYEKELQRLKDKEVLRRMNS